MFCTRCGTSNSNESMVCTNCSAPLVRPGETPRAQGPAGYDRTPSPYSSGANWEQNPPPPAQSSQPYPEYRSSYSESQGYQPYQSTYANQMPVQQASASGRAIAAMILSLVAIPTCFGPLLSIPGFILGKMEMNAIRAGTAPRAGETFAKVGFYVGIITTIIYCLLGAGWLALLTIGSISNSF